MVSNDDLRVELDDFDRFLTGCDSRIAYSSAISADAIKYWLNVQNNRIVQRRLGITGSAALGEYNVDFGDNDNLAGAVGVNAASKNDNRYWKTVSNSSFDYSVSNCSISGWMLDYLKRLNDISSGYTLVTGGASGPDAYNDDITDFAGEYSVNVNSTIWEVSLLSQTVNELHVYYYYHLFSNSGNTKIFLDMEVGGSWINIAHHDQIGAGTKTGTEAIHDYTTRNNVTGIRYRTENANTFHIAKLKLYDISGFE